MAVTSEFTADRGYRFRRNETSILVEVLGQSKPGIGLSKEQLNSLFRATHQYLQNAGAYDASELKPSPIIDASNFPRTKDTEFFKFVSDHTLDRYILNGGFQFGSLQYYRDIEDQNSKDGREGQASLVIATPEFEIFVSLVAGYNFAIFSGTSASVI